MEKAKLVFLSEDEKRKQRLKRTPTERFDMLMKLIRIGKMLEKARLEAKQKKGK